MWGREREGQESMGPPVARSCSHDWRNIPHAVRWAWFAEPWTSAEFTVSWETPVSSSLDGSRGLCPAGYNIPALCKLGWCSRRGNPWRKLQLPSLREFSFLDLDRIRSGHLCPSNSSLISISVIKTLTNSPASQPCSLVDGGGGRGKLYFTLTAHDYSVTMTTWC